MGNRFYASLPIADKTDNLASLFGQALFKGNIRCKSGTLSNVKGFSGYCTNQGGDAIAFAIIFNHYDGPLSSAEGAMERILEVLIQHK